MNTEQTNAEQTNDWTMSPMSGGYPLLSTPTDAGTDDHLAMGAELIAAELSGSPTATMQRWDAAADRIVRHVQSADFRADKAVTLHGWPFSASSALVVRAFELWTHTDDIRRAAGLPAEHTDASELRTMSESLPGASCRAI